VTENKPKLT